MVEVRPLCWADRAEGPQSRGLRSGAVVRAASWWPVRPVPQEKVELMGPGQGGRHVALWLGQARPTGVARRQPADRGPGSGPVCTGVSAGGSWGRGSSAWGRSRWALPWRQLEHLQVPLVALSPARDMQGEAEGTVNSQARNTGET